MDIQKEIDEMFDNITSAFVDDGMVVKMPDNLVTALKQEMADRLCSCFNDIRDDMEMDVRGYAKTEESSATGGATK